MKKDKLPFTLEEFKHIYTRVPRLCVIPVIKNSKGFLLTLRNIEPAKGMWHFPGGTVLLEESLEEALKRVAKKELNINIEIGSLVGIIEYYKTKSVIGHSVVLLYLVKPDGQIKLNKEASDFGYFEAPPENMVPEEAEFMKGLIQK